ncbi:MAG: tetratricopeptide repeat protein [Armatimonadetes bacterium]|nr:tetratricopeptide repeat protein [Armatimonadota bacterium]
MITENKQIRNFKNTYKFFLNPAYNHSHDPVLEKDVDVFMYRPLLMTTFALNYLWGKLNPQGYHLVNLILHALNGFLVYLILRILAHKRAGKMLSGDILALLIALLFISHPIQTESVTYIVSRSTLLYSFFYLLAFYYFLKFSKTDGISNYIFSNLFFIFSLPSKEAAITFPLIILAYQFFYDKKVEIKKILPYFIIAFIFIGFQYLWQSQGLVFKRDFSQVLTYWTIQSCVFIYYIKLLIWPINLNLDYDFPVYHSFLEIYPLLSGIFLLFLIILAFKIKNKFPLFSFFILWFFITQAAEAVIPLLDVIFEHRLYLPVLSFLVFFSLFLESVINYLHLKFNLKTFFSQTALILLFLALGIFYTNLTISRNLVWSSELSLWKDCALKSPNKSRTHLGLAAAYYNAGHINKSILEYQKALRLSPDSILIYRDLSSLYIREKKYKEVLAIIQKGLKIKEDFLLYNNLGIILMKQNKDSQAVLTFQKSIKLADNFFAHNNLGKIYMKLNNFSASEKELQESLNLNPGQLGVYFNLGLLYFNHFKNYPEAIKYFQETYLRLQDNSKNLYEIDLLKVYYYLSQTYNKLNNLEEARFWKNKYLELKGKKSSLLK